MISQPNPEPTLIDVIAKLDKLSSDVEGVKKDVEGVKKDVEGVKKDVEGVKKDVEGLKQFDQRFAEYRQATQWVVQLAFTLIASATITVIITSVFRR